MTNEALEEAWRSFWLDQNREARNQLMIQHGGLVHMVVGKMLKRGLPSSIEKDDLVSFGTFGLIRAIESYDPERGVRFTTYATHRIRGNILDELRKMDWVPRGVRSDLRDVERVRSELQVELSREPLDEEVAERLDITILELWARQDKANSIAVGALDELDSTASLSSFLDANSNPEDLIEVEEVGDLLAEAISRLTEQEQTILVLYYLQGMTLSEVGAVLGVTESRVCQLQGKVLLSLRAELGPGMLSAA